MVRVPFAVVATQGYTSYSPEHFISLSGDGAVLRLSILRLTLVLGEIQSVLSWVGLPLWVWPGSQTEGASASKRNRKC